MVFALTLTDIVAFISPAPISPLFQIGGKFEGWNEDLVLVAFFIIMLAALDNFAVAPLLRAKVQAFKTPNLFRFLIFAS